MSKIVFFFSLIIIFFFNNSFSQYQFEDAFPNLSNFTGSVDLQNSRDCTNRLFVVEQGGRIVVFENRKDVSDKKVFLDITDRITSGGELGLLGLAFHPDFENNGYFYVNYTAPEPRRTVISRFQVSTTNPDSANKESELILLTQTQPYSNHNGGQMAFGPDGYLYFSLGDGGSGGDPENHAQRLVDLLGKISRIDVDNTDGDLDYSIPADNPFKGNTAGYREEIFAYGLRNPWRFSFDFETGLLWCADVGQNSREEINIIEKGGNYGWRCYEGNLPYNTTGCDDSSNYIFPIWDYPRGDGYSVTGGYVYRGPDQPGLFGKYIYADWGSNNIWSLEYDGSTANNSFLITASASPTSFGVDEANEMYVCGGSRIYKFVSTAAITAPSALSAEVTAQLVIQLNWFDNSDNEVGFTIERMNAGGDYAGIGSVSANEASYIDNVTEAIDYKYRIRAFNATDTSGYSNESCISGTTVPVELGLFTIDIDKEESSVMLRWETVSEKNNHGFEIERRFNEINTNWFTIGFVEGKGTTTEKAFYKFRDNLSNQGFNGSLQYRLKQVDFNGDFSYSGIVEIDLNILRKNYELLQNYPNPFNPTTEIRFNIPEESKVKIEVVNSLGEFVTELVNEVRPTGFYNISWNAGNFSSGVYLIRFHTKSLVSNESYFNSIKMLYLK